jgi:hypothetical protein
MKTVAGLVKWYSMKVAKSIHMQMRYHKVFKIEIILHRIQNGYKNGTGKGRALPISF